MKMKVLFDFTKAGYRVAISSMLCVLCIELLVPVSVYYDAMIVNVWK